MKKKDKKKKVKSVLGVPIDYDFGKKVKDISIDINKYKDSRLVLLILLNIMLICTLGYYLSIVSNALLISISIFTVSVCIGWSIFSYKKGVIKIKYTLYENVIVKNFDNFKNIGILQDLTGYRVVKTLLDKYGKNKTKSLVLRFSNKLCPKLVLTCIDEDIDEILNLIHKLRKVGKKKQEQLKSNPTPLIKTMIEKNKEIA